MVEQLPLRRHLDFDEPGAGQAAANTRKALPSLAFRVSAGGFDGKIRQTLSKIPSRLGQGFEFVLPGVFMTRQPRKS
jgi:hypothetical protein